jgi:hypothetical protein
MCVCVCLSVSLSVCVCVCARARARVRVCSRQPELHSDFKQWIHQGSDFWEFVGPLYSKCTRALTFETLYQGWLRRSRTHLSGAVVNTVVKRCGSGAWYRLLSRLTEHTRFIFYFLITISDYYYYQYHCRAVWRNTQGTRILKKKNISLKWL